MANRLLLSVCLLVGLSAACRNSGKGTPATSIVLPKNVRIDSIVVLKAGREMQVYSNKRLVKTYTVCLGLNPVGPKQVQGDYKTPEGLYYINLKNPNSQYHKGLGISYPNNEDRARAKRMGKSPGGDVIIHGLPNTAENKGPGHYRNDWTWGCIALTDAEVDELYEHVPVGIPILIKP